MEYEKIHAIVNPNSAGGKTKENWPALQKKIEKTLGSFSFAETAGKGDGKNKAKEAALSGKTETLLIVGGDGTLSEVVDGILNEFPGGKGAENIKIGLIPQGTAGDFTRSLGLPLKTEPALEKIKAGNTVTADAGKAEYVTMDGKNDSRHFVHAVACGMAGEVSGTIKSGLKKMFGGFSYYLWAATKLLSYKNKKVLIRLNGDSQGEPHDITNLAICNGTFYGGGMRMAPGAIVDDGSFNLTIVGDWSVLDKLLLSSKLYNGSIHSAKKVQNKLVRSVEIVPRDGSAPAHIDIDGEWVGVLPLKITMIPSAIRLIV